VAVCRGVRCAQVWHSIGRVRVVPGCARDSRACPFELDKALRGGTVGGEFQALRPGRVAAYASRLPYTIPLGSDQGSGVRLCLLGSQPRSPGDGGEVEWDPLAEGSSAPLRAHCVGDVTGSVCRQRLPFGRDVEKRPKTRAVLLEVSWLPGHFTGVSGVLRGRSSKQSLPSPP